MKKDRQERRGQNKILAKKLGITLFWILIWQLLALAIENRILMAGPVDTLRALVSGVKDGDFLQTCFYSIARIGMGVLLGGTMGVVLGCLAYKFKHVRDLLVPVMSFLKAVPVAAIVVLLLIWWGSRGLSVAIVCIVVLPIIYTNVVQGLMATDKKMLEMAKVFKLPLWNKAFYIYRPALAPFMESGLKIALGMSWKSGVAAEVIGLPEFSFGERMYMSKLYLDTAGLFAWTGTVILLSFLFEKAGLYLWKRFCLWKPGFVTARKGMDNIHGETGRDIQLQGICKSFTETPVLENITCTLETGKIYCLMAPSGEGKTTLLRILAGMEMPDEGKSVLPVNCSMAFQEDRLAEQLTAQENILLLLGNQGKGKARVHLEQLLPKESLRQRCHTFSGGMKRRVSLVRAVLADSDLLLLDEPFAGLDEENKNRAVKYLLENQKGRTIVVATHDETDALLLGATVWKL